MEQTTKLDCKGFVQLVQLMLDGEATPEQQELFRQHYNRCKHCAEHYSIEESTLKFLKKKVCACRAHAPQNLLGMIKSKIDEICQK
jgi:mycothiol system anti-sigma-R factor